MKTKKSFAGILIAIGFVLALGACGNNLLTNPPGKIYDVSGQSLHMVCMGDGAPTTVIEFGITNWSIHWKLVQEALAQNTRVCAYDRAGLGWSGEIVEPISGEALVGQLHGLLKQSGEPGPYLLVGHSFGGYIVRLFYASYPDEVIGIVLVEAAHEDQWQRLPPSVNQMTQAGLQKMKQAMMISHIGGLNLIDIPLTDPLPTKEQRKFVKQAMRTTRYYDTAIKYFEAIPQIAQDVRDAGDLGDLPTMVLSAGKSADAYCGRNFGVNVPCRETQDAWMMLQDDLATLSSNMAHYRAPMTRHYIQLDDPTFVVFSISEMILSLKAR